MRQEEKNIEPETLLAIPCSKASAKSSKETAQVEYDSLKIHSKVDEEFETKDIEHTTAKEPVKAGVEGDAEKDIEVDAEGSADGASDGAAEGGKVG